MDISEIMTPCPYCIKADSSLSDAFEQMKLHSVRHLPVIDNSGEILGVLTERDLRLSKLICDDTGYCPSAEELCSKEPRVVLEETEVSEVTRIMEEEKLDYVLVQGEEGSLTGIFTNVDACRLVRLLLGQSN